MKVLFLDFDGVLHGTDAGSVEYHGSAIRHSGEWLFSRLYLLEELLTRCPDLSIIVSSSWQHCYAEDNLKEFLGGAGHRVVGTTCGIVPSNCSSANRFEECLAAAQALATDTWVMVDDQPSLVWGNRVPNREEMARVVFCDPVLGLTPLVIDILAKKLS